MKNKLLIICGVLLIFLILPIILFKNNYKIFKFGNNTSIKTLNDVEDYILNISSYSAQIEVTVNSNKNSNKYIINQQYSSENVFKQEILEPSNIKGIIIKYDGKNLEIVNSQINLTSLYENYTYIADNVLWLNSFIEDYRNTDNKKIKEENDEYIIELKSPKNKYNVYKTLYINKNNGLPSKMLISDENGKGKISIIYKEIKINTTNSDEILAIRNNPGKIKEI